MKKSILKIGVLVMMALCALPALAQLNGTGYYRVRNAQSTSDYISMANDKFHFTTVISSAGGGLGSVTGAGLPSALDCTDKYLRNDIHMVDDPDIINPATVIYAKKKNTNTSNHDYNLIAQGTSLLTLTSGSYPGTLTVTFSNRYITIDNVSGSGANSLYTAKIVLEGTYLFGSYSLGTRYFIDDNGAFGISESYSAQNAKWYVEPVTHFNVFPEFELNGKYYTTIKVPFAFKLSGQVERAYVITAIDDGTLAYLEIASNGDTVPAGAAVLLECGSPLAADCLLIPTGEPIFTAPSTTTTTGAPAASEGSNYTGTNLLDGTYYCNTDGQIPYPKYNKNTGAITTDYLDGDNFEPTSGKYVIGYDEDGKLGFVPATGTAMPANKAWLTSAGLFPAAATPTYSPAAGTYTEALSVSIVGEDADAIYYTTDGSTPTTASTLYTGPIEVSETTTIKAIAVRNGLYNYSDVATAEYVINIPTPSKPGDVNGDGEVDINDVTLLISKVLGQTITETFIESNADLDGNNDLDINDVTDLIDLVLG